MTGTDAQCPTAAAFELEWRRIELLGHCLSESRHGREIADDVVDELRELQGRVEAGRNGHGIWSRLLPDSLEPLEYDVVACSLGAEAEPRLAWIFQNLQAGVPQPYPTPSLLQELLALDFSAFGALHELLADNARMRREQLIDMDAVGAFEPIRPGRFVVGRLLNRQRTQPSLPGAVRVPVKATWDDLVLPGDRLRMLRELVNRVKHRSTVVDEWGGKEHGGPLALFSGPSGTGKTFAASVVAGELDWPLYRVDLGRLISKYIGETEKNLNLLFDAAHDQPMVLQFDEADSVFGRRGAIKEARDRYANMEVSHLLARIETHHGPCILTTNLQGNLDPAFSRRFQVVVEFPRPDGRARAELWRRSLPPRAPICDKLDLELVAESVILTGGEIHNAALHAAYLAAAEAEPRIGLRYVALAVWRELAKNGRQSSGAELGPLFRYLEIREGEAVHPEH